MQQEIIRWYHKNKRDLPWRSTTAWGVLVSEFMLQQTPVARVLPIWREWMERWPDPKALAQTSRAEVIRAWGTLGYPRRAIRLHETSMILVNEFDSKVPDNLVALRRLPGVGEYTAAAIIAFAFGKKSLVLDTNIRRLFARMIDGYEFPNLNQTLEERTKRELLIPRNASTWAAGTMELGALICTARNPKCDLCPVSEICRWKQAGFPKSEIKKKAQGWHGTNRQCRGVILKELREKDHSTSKRLNEIWSNQSQLEEALKSLIADGFIKKTKDKYSLIN